jgi:uncharacterized membrane protein
MAVKHTRQGWRSRGYAQYLMPSRCWLCIVWEETRNPAADAKALLDSQHLNNHALPPLTVELGVEDALPRA